MAVRTRVVIILVVTMMLGGCRAFSRLDSTMDSVDRLADNTDKLVRTASEAITQVNETVSMMDTHLDKLAAESIPDLLGSTDKMLKTIERSTHATSQATVTLLEASTKSMNEVTPDLRRTLMSVSTMVDHTKEAIVGISAGMDRAASGLERVAAKIEKSTEVGGAMLVSTQKELNKSLIASQDTLHQTSASLLRLEQESTKTMQAMRGSLEKLTSLFTLELTSDDDEAIDDVASKVDDIVTLGIIWFSISQVLLVVITVLLIQHKLSTKGRHEAQARRLGLPLDSHP